MRRCPAKRKDSATGCRKNLVASHRAILQFRFDFLEPHNAAHVLFIREGGASMRASWAPIRLLSQSQTLIQEGTGALCDSVQTFVDLKPYHFFLEPIMKTFSSLLLTAASLAGPAAFAQNNETQTMTRAEVVAELQTAQAAGRLSVGELDYPPAIQQTSSVTRALVLAERRAAQAAGQLSVGELDYPPVHNQTSTVTRAQVVAELKAAKSTDQLTEPAA